MTGRHSRVVVLAGPSGAGKSRLAARLQQAHGWPIVRLDDFYRDEDDPAMPRSEELGIIDWDHPDSWNREAALDALGRLVRDGAGRDPRLRASPPTVPSTGPWSRPGPATSSSPRASSPPRSSPTCTSSDCSPAPSASTTSRWVTFARRLARDLAERRKPPLTLVRRGLALAREEPSVIRRQEALGAEPARAADLEGRLSTLAALAAT